MRFEHRPRARGLLALFLSVALAETPTHAADVPAATAVKIVMAAVAYDNSAGERFGDEIRVRLVGEGERADDLAEALSHLADKRLRGKPLRFRRDTFETALSQGADLVFFAQPLGPAARSRVDACIAQRWTCVAAGRDDVSAGIPLGIDVRADGRPVLLVNIDAARAAGMDLPASVVQVAEIIRR